MGFEDVSEKVVWEARRIAATFGVEKWIVSTTEFEGYANFEGYARETLVTWDIDLVTSSLDGLCLGRFPDNYTQVIYRLKTDNQWFCESNSGASELMARGLYRLGIEDEDVLAELNYPLTAHEKLQLRLSLPREFWPQKWIDEEKGQTSATSSPCEYQTSVTERVWTGLLMMDEYMEIAILNDNVKLLRELLEEKPERLEERNKYGETPLIMAVYTPKRSIGVIKTLLDAGADINARNRGGFMALHVVIWNEYFYPPAPRSEEIVALLLDAGVALEDDQNDRVCTPLMTAVNEDLCEDARLLLARGANPNKFLSEKLSAYSVGWSLLSSAWLDPEMVQVLLEGGADVNLRNAFGQTPIEEIESRDAEQFNRDGFDAQAQKQQSLELLRRAQQSTK